MQLGVQALIVGHDVEHAGALLPAVNVHGHPAVKRAVVLVQCVSGALLIYACHIGAGEGVLAAVSDDDVGSGSGGVHLGGGCLLVRAAALVHVVEYQCRRHGAGHIHVIEYKRDNGVGVVGGIVAQVNGYLSLGQRAAQAVSAGLTYGDHSVGIRLLGGVFVGLCAFAVIGALTRLVVDYVMTYGHGAGIFFSYGLAVEGDLIVRENKLILFSSAFRRLSSRICGYFRGLSGVIGAVSAGGQREGQHSGERH